MSVTDPTRRRPPTPRTGARPAPAPAPPRARVPRPTPAETSHLRGVDDSHGSAFSRIWDAPTTTYYLLLIVTTLLLGFGLVMVLSASTVFSLRATGGQSPFGDFLNQGKFALIAIPVAVIAARLPVRMLRALAWPAYLFGLGLLTLGFVPAFTVSAGGNAAWVTIAGQSFQPGEFAKLGLALWLGLMLSRQGPNLGRWRDLIVGGIGTAAVLVGVLYTGDLGTGLIFFALVFGALWVAGVPFMKIAVLGMGAVAVVVAYLFSGESRLNRILHFAGQGDNDPLGLGMQPLRALQGLGTGSWSGVGLGASRVKWSYLPEAHNDYIFAIIGEELGLLGTLMVLLLFFMLAVGLTRVVRRHNDPYAKIATGAIGTWILFQAIVNIGVTIGLFPVVGVPLPLISAGGSSLITTLVALGFVIGFARNEPGAREALAARKFSIRRSVGALAPQGRSQAGRRGR